MPQALFVGGTRFIGRHAVETFLDAGYEVTLCTRGEHDSPFADRDGVDHVRGDRTSDAALKNARDEVDPDVVVDTCAYFPGEVRHATDIFADVDAYVYVSSGGAYGREEIPKREGETPLEPCSDEQAVTDSRETYGPRKAEGDRAVFAAAEEGINALSVRPTVVYGPHDYSGRFAYWVDRVTTYDRVIVPDAGTPLWHMVAVENVARAILRVAEDGQPGSAYNVGDRQLFPLREVVERIAAAADADVEVVTAGTRELAAGDLEPGEFPLYRDYPHVLDTTRLENLGWDPVPAGEAIESTVAWHQDRDSGTDGDNGDSAAEVGPDRAAEERVLEILDTI